jgi:hypothetical protein
MYRLGWSVQVPKHRAVERDEQAIVTWGKEAWPAGNGSGAAARVAGLRGRGRSDAAPAEGPHLGQTRAHPGDCGVR